MNAPLTLIDAIEAMVAQKYTVGYKYEAEEAILDRFVAFTRSQFPGLETITEVSAHAWIEAAQKRAVTPSTLQGLASPVRHLANGWYSTTLQLMCYRQVCCLGLPPTFHTFIPMQNWSPSSPKRIAAITVATCLYGT